MGEGPVGEVPLLHIGITFIVDIIKGAAVGDEVGGIVVDVQAGGIEQAAHRLHLRKPIGVYLSRVEQLRHGRPGDVFLQVRSCGRSAASSRGMGMPSCRSVS